MSFRGYMLLVVALIFSGILFSQSQKEREQKKPVDIKAEVANRYPDLDQNAIVLTGEVVFHHNGTVISCDSAIRYSDKRIDCFKNVIINKDSIFIYGDRAEYNGEINLAKVYSPVIKIIDGDATLYTYNFTFNTQTNVGIYYGGGIMYQKDNVMESERGYYYSDEREMVGVRNVEMKNDDYTMTGDSVRYNMDTKVASFFTKSYIWTEEGDMITADRGRYNTIDSTYFFYHNAYILTEFRETWADTIDFNAKRQDAWLYGNIQINDDENSSSAFGEFGQYWGERGETMLTKRPSLFNYSEEQNKNDTVYMRADTIFMYVLYPTDRLRKDSLQKERADPLAHLKFADLLSDSLRLLIADSLKPVILRLRTESNSLKHTADSIVNVLYPPTEKTFVPTEEIHNESSQTALHDSLQPIATAALPTVMTDPSSILSDSLSMFEKVKELLPDSLSAQSSSLLLGLLDEKIPEGMTHLVSDSIDVAALRNVLQMDIATSDPQPVATSAPERYIPPHVKAMLERVEQLNAELDSLQTAESYIRPKLKLVSSEGLVVTDSLPRADSIVLDDSLSHLDKRALKKFRKDEKRRLKAERKVEKQRLKEEKRAAKAARKAEKAAERRRRLILKGRITDSLPGDRAMVPDSLITPLSDSLELATVDEPEVDKDTTERIVRGWRNVRIWRKDMQAVCDSIVGFSFDSTIHMYVDPILWHAESQIVCDSLTLLTNGESVDRGEFYGNPIMSSKFGDAQFNQVTGRTMTSWFRDNEVYRHDVTGNAEAYYFIQEDDDPRPVAFIVASSANMSFILEDQFVRYIISRENVEWPVYPIDQIPLTQPTELKGFTWREERKPALKDVFDRDIRPAERAFHENIELPKFPIGAKINRRREYLIENRLWADRIDPLPSHAVEFVISLQND